MFSYSALRVGGQRSSDLARQGLSVPLTPRLANITQLELLNFNAPHFTLRKSYRHDQAIHLYFRIRSFSSVCNFSQLFHHVGISVFCPPPCLPLFVLGVSCGGGTYMRSLVHAIGRDLSTYAVMTNLSRTKHHHFHLEHPNTLNFESITKQQIQYTLSIPLYQRLKIEKQGSRPSTSASAPTSTSTSTKSHQFLAHQLPTHSNFHSLLTVPIRGHRAFTSFSSTHVCRRAPSSFSSFSASSLFVSSLKSATQITHFRRSLLFLSSSSFSVPSTYARFYSSDSSDGEAIPVPDPSIPVDSSLPTYNQNALAEEKRDIFTALEVDDKVDTTHIKFHQHNTISVHISNMKT